MAEGARVAFERGWVRMDWAVLEWNAPSIEFYERLGATRHGGWHTYRLDSEQMRTLANESEAAQKRAGRATGDGSRAT